ncbi:hypothetical protein F9L33_14180 [Amylibacter sp. SFDW26]|uniref:hypothetical protein n=1 Tax=Amylibacter sp. SFDW26 TaxID=2652722 RepID=UPI0012621D34|nr:hypothetical protein [Amylibacter sp. SFDW26]KAB7610443.1 hypothetical protein F9L33_14180 [Amylibacter sp. SFDW26]
MENIYLYSAGALSILWCFVHFFIGGKEIAAPLRVANGLNPTQRSVAWMCWHMVTLNLFLMGVFFILGAKMDQVGLIWAATALSISFLIAGLLIPPLSGVTYRAAPQGWLFLPTTILGLLVVLA